MKKRTLPTIPTPNLGLLERLYKNGVVWLLLFIIFFMVHPADNYLTKVVGSLCLVGLAFLLVTFINKVLISAFLMRKRVVLFVLLSILSIVTWAAGMTALEACLVHWIEGVSFSEMPFFPDILVIFLVRLMWFLATYAIVVIFYYQRKENEERLISDQLKSEKLDMELRYLKSQINPHFLFNALNNIYSMVYTHDDNAANGVLKLSEMLRYVLVDCQAEVIPLSKEIKYIENFIDFQMMRINGERNIVFESEIEKEDFLIVPMLLQPLIENCFKYSRLENHPDGYVHVFIKQEGDKFSFVAENTVASAALPLNVGASEKKSGIGLNNVRQRLLLHYGENYTFDIEEEGQTYKVKITL